MKTVVYADILIFINFIVNYLMLKTVAYISAHKTKRWRILLSSFIGALFSLIIYIENIPFIINILIKILFMSFMILLAFEIKTFRSFLKNLLLFFTVNIIFGGIMLVINIFLLPESSLYNNGVVYFDLDILSLTLISFISYILLTAINKIIKNKTPSKCSYSIRIKYDDETIEGNALFDSGNTLCDCFSGKPVIIANKTFLNKITNRKPVENLKNFRMIPFGTINGNGVMPAFSPDSVSIYAYGKWIDTEDVYIGITENKIISGEYSALIGKPFFDLINN